MSTRLRVGDTVRTSFVGRDCVGTIAQALSLDSLFLVTLEDPDHPGSTFPVVREERALRPAAAVPAGERVG